MMTDYLKKAARRLLRLPAKQPEPAPADPREASYHAPLDPLPKPARTPRRPPRSDAEDWGAE